MQFSATLTFKKISWGPKSSFSRETKISLISFLRKTWSHFRVSGLLLSVQAEHLLGREFLLGRKSTSQTHSTSFQKPSLMKILENQSVLILDSKVSLLLTDFLHYWQ